MLPDTGFGSAFDWQSLFLMTLSIGTVYFGAKLAVKQQHHHVSSSSSSSSSSSGLADASVAFCSVLVPTDSIFIPLACAVLLFLLHHFLLLRTAAIAMMLATTLGAVFYVSQPFLHVLLRKYAPHRLSQNVSLSMGFSVLCVCIWLQWHGLWMCNILAVFLCLATMQFLRTPSLAVITYLLSALALYNFVFTARAYRELGDAVFLHLSAPVQMPIVFEIPRRIPGNDYRTSVVSIGDVALPGIACVYALRLGPAYFTTAVGGFAGGLLLHFVCLYEHGLLLPAMCFVGPSTVVAILVRAWQRGEVQHVWRGSLAQLREQDLHASLVSQELLAKV